MDDEPMLEWFTYEHLPEDLKEVSRTFSSQAVLMCRLLPRTPERTVALRKLLESKDAAVRCAVSAR